MEATGGLRSVANGSLVGMGKYIMVGFSLTTAGEIASLQGVKFASHMRSGDVEFETDAKAVLDELAHAKEVVFLVTDSGTDSSIAVGIKE
ncbi:uncharacterized protein A4U43_C08F17810 [Asparagus officinalis]|nr:uncharacterized protein A4U43_C08F17810 [Asparagus officinalis]